MTAYNSFMQYISAVKETLDRPLKEEETKQVMMNYILGESVDKCIDKLERKK